MKNTKKKILFPLILLLFFASCKYEDGPAISLRSKTARLLGTWKIENLKIDGIDSTQLYNDSCGCELEFVSAQTYTWFDAVLLKNCKNNPNFDPNYVGWWTFENHHKILNVGFTIGAYEGLGPIGFGKSKISDWEILKLTNKNFWFKTTFNNKQYIFKLINK